MDIGEHFLEPVSSEDELEIQLLSTRKNNENYLEQIVPQYDEKEFFEHFRISREVARDIADRYQESEQYNRHHGKYGKILSLYQTCSYCDVADRFDIAISSLHEIVRRVSVFLSNLAPQIIRWPKETEKSVGATHFRNNGCPNVIGAIDGCHIRIDKPHNDPDSYVNRKGYSVQMQAVVDHSKRCVDVFIGHPVSVHDSRVFRNSTLGNNLETKCGRYYLLGDSGYPVKKNLLNQFKDRGNLTPQQLNYNIKLSKIVMYLNMFLVC